MKFKNYKRKISWVYLIQATMFFFILFLFTSRTEAFELQARIETRYELQTGDNATDHDLFQYQLIDLQLMKNLTFGWFGEVRKDLDGKTDDITAGGEEKTDVSFQGLPDAANPNQTFEYRVYTAYLKYDTGRFGAIVGRSGLFEYEFSQFDGIMLWVSPFDWLRIEGFGGKPWHYNYVNDINYYLGAGEIIAGAGTDFRLLDERLALSLRYLYLKEKTQDGTLIDEDAKTYLSDDHIAKTGVSYNVSNWLQTGFLFSLLNTSPRSAHIWFSGTFDRYLVNYLLEYYMQFIDISDLGDSRTQFSSLLTSSYPYLRATASLTKNFSDILNLRGINDVELEIGYEHRQPTSSSDESQFNPHYDLFRVGSIISFPKDWYFQIFYEFILTSGIKNDIHTVGGEIVKKWEKFKMQLGSSYYASKYETNYSKTVMEDSFFAQEYYFKLKWLPLKSLDISIKTSFEIAELTSLTSAEKINDQVISVPMTELLAEPRKYLKFDIRTGYQF